MPATVNLDFADVSSVMRDSGYAHMGVGSASGRDKAEAAAHEAITSPLIETSMQGAKGLIVCVNASPDIGLDEVSDASTIIQEAAHPDANIIWGIMFDDKLEDTIKITVVATGASEMPKQPSNDTSFNVDAGNDDDDFYDDVSSIFNK